MKNPCPVVQFIPFFVECDVYGLGDFYRASKRYRFVRTIARLSTSTYLIWFPSQNLRVKIALHRTYLANLNSISCPLLVAKTPFLDNAAFCLVLKVGDDPAKQTSYSTASGDSLRTAR